MLHNNPFIHGNPVLPEQFIGRNVEIRKIVGRIVTGQSTAITGSPRSGKTSMLEYLRAPETQVTLYNDEADQLIFSYVDACTLEAEIDLTQFWALALKPLKKLIVAKHANSVLSQTFQTFEENGFLAEDEFEEFVAQLQQTGWRFILMLDEFEFLLHHPNLNSVKFFGTLRKRFSLSKGAFVLVTTANISRKKLNQKTRRINPGSPYFNFLEEITIDTFMDEASINELLHQGAPYFLEDDYGFIKNLAGGHPYRLQLAASMLWEIYEGGDENEPLKRQKLVRQQFNSEREDKQNLVKRIYHTILSYLEKYQHFLNNINFENFLTKVENSKYYRIIAVVGVVLGIVATILTIVLVLI